MVAGTKSKAKPLDKLEKHVYALLDEVMKAPDASITDKTKVMDRVLKFEAIKHKVDEGGEDSEWEN